jgi:hypothetical protein
MPTKIQRVPRGVLELLSAQSGQTPTELADQVRGSLEMLQYYGLQQLQTVRFANAVATLNQTVPVTPSDRFWTVVFQASCRIVKTATQTALVGSVACQRQLGLDISNMISGEMPPYGAGAVGVDVLSYVPPYPMICPPGAIWIARTLVCDDATADVQIHVEYGLLG